MNTHPSSNNLDYIDTTSYEELSQRLKDLKEILDNNLEKSRASRKLRYSEVDIEAERETGRIQPDELYLPQHIIDTNIRMEQPSYVKYITESPRAVILEDQDDLSTDLSLLEKDLTKRIRFKGWQLSQYANIDAFQSNGYSVMEVIQDQSAPGGVSHEMVQYGDFGFICDTRDIQQVEMVGRSYYYTRTQLINLCRPAQNKTEDDIWDYEQVQKLTDQEPTTDSATSDFVNDAKERSLYRVQKIMFKIQGVVQVGWACIGLCDNWLRKPRPLFIGRRQLIPQHPVMGILRQATNQLPPSSQATEQEYPFFLFPYLISENDTIMELKGRVFLDQDMQEAISSLLSSTVTQSRRAAGLYFSKDENDPNDDVLLQKNVFFKSGSIINSKIKSFALAAPDPSIFTAIQSLGVAKQAETSQVSFATKNRKDSRKTAKELDIAEQQTQSLSTIQVVLFSIALQKMYSVMADVIKSRVQAGLIKVDPLVRPLYDRTFIVKPSGDIDVIEKQQLIQTMMSAWPVIQSTAAAPLFLIDLIEKMFPFGAAKYIKAIQDATAQQQSQQAQQMQMVVGEVQKLGQGIVQLSKHPEYFSDTGRIHAYPLVEIAAEQFEQMAKQAQAPQQAQPAQMGQQQ